MSVSDTVIFRWASKLKKKKKAAGYLHEEQSRNSRVDKDHVLGLLLGD